MLNCRTALFGVGAVLALLLALNSWAVGPAGSAFTYQGLLNQSGQPIPDGSTVDLQFTLWDGSGVSAAQIGTTQQALGMTINDGLVTTQLDFGAAAFNGQERWLEIALRSPAGSGSYTTLSPRQPLTAAPYALYSLGPWQTSGPDLFYTAGKVGIGTSTPGSSLQVAGGIRALGGVPAGNNGYAFDSDSSTGLFSPVSGAIQLWGSSLARVTINSAGKVGIGTTTPVNTLDVEGGAAIGAGYSGTIATPAPTNGLIVQGSVGIGVTIPAAKLDVAGSLIVTSCFGCSDARFKTNVTPLRDALETVVKLRGVSFDWRCDAFPERGFNNERQVGLIAQEVRDVAPEVVLEGGDGYLSVDYGRLTPVIIEAVKELKAGSDQRLAEKDAQIKTLQSQVDDLNSEMNELKALVSRLAADHQ